MRFATNLAVVSMALLFMASLGWATDAANADKPTVPQEILAPDIAIDELALRLTPLTVAELAAAAEAWRDIVKGKTEPVGIHEVLDYHTEASFPNLMEAVSYFKDGVGHYRRGKWQQAVTAFTEVLKLNPSDHLAQVYIERCEHMQAHPPADDWDGVWVMQSK